MRSSSKSGRAKRFSPDESIGLSICRSIVEAHAGRLWATVCGHSGLSFSLLFLVIELRCRQVDVSYWHFSDIAGRAGDVGLPGQSGHSTGNDDIVGDDGDDHPIPACRIVAVALPPALDSAFMVSWIAATGVVKAA